MSQPRKPKGSPAGGQFDTSAGGGVAVDLDASGESGRDKIQTITDAFEARFAQPSVLGPDFDAYGALSNDLIIDNETDNQATFSSAGAKMRIHTLDGERFILDDGEKAWPAQSREVAGYLDDWAERVAKATPAARNAARLSDGDGKFANLTPSDKLRAKYGDTWMQERLNEYANAHFDGNQSAAALDLSLWHLTRYTREYDPNEIVDGEIGEVIREESEVILPNSWDEAESEWQSRCVITDGGDVCYEYYDDPYKSLTTETALALNFSGASDERKDYVKGLRQSEPMIGDKVELRGGGTFSLDNESAVNIWRGNLCPNCEYPLGGATCENPACNCYGDSKILTTAKDDWGQRRARMEAIRGGIDECLAAGDDQGFSPLQPISNDQPSPYLGYSSTAGETMLADGTAVVTGRGDKGIAIGVAKAQATGQRFQAVFIQDDREGDRIEHWAFGTIEKA